MKIGVIGTGIVGRTLATGLRTAGHEVSIGTRNPQETLSRSDFEGWDTGQIPIQEIRQTADTAELIFNATIGSASLEALSVAGAAALDSKILVDVANPLDFSKGFPPTLTIVNDDSLAEQIQAQFPGARVVKALNTVNAEVMANPSSLSNGEHSAFVCGNDEAAKSTVKQVLSELGWRDIIDLGDLSNARGLEMYLALWVRLYAALGTPNFNLHIKR
jgi:8-hydroxy-5-deazaflavin:NADPH oxidoreductase